MLADHSHPLRLLTGTLPHRQAARSCSREGTDGVRMLACSRSGRHSSAERRRAVFVCVSARSMFRALPQCSKMMRGCEPLLGSKN